MDKKENITRTRRNPDHKVVVNPYMLFVNFFFLAILTGCNLTGLTNILELTDYSGRSGTISQTVNGEDCSIQANSEVTIGAKEPGLYNGSQAPSNYLYPIQGEGCTAYVNVNQLKRIFNEIPTLTPNPEEKYYQALATAMVGGKPTPTQHQISSTPTPIPANK